MKSILKKIKAKKFTIVLVLLFISIIYSVLVTLDDIDQIRKKEALSDYYNHPGISKVSPTSVPTTKPLVNPCQGNKQIEDAMLKDLGAKNVELKIINIIDDYAYITQHALPPGGGGGWGVVRHQSGKWRYVFLRSDEVFCNLYDQYNLPPGLLGACD